jgi:hypothetical protein
MYRRRHHDFGPDEAQGELTHLSSWTLSRSTGKASVLCFVPLPFYKREKLDKCPKKSRFGYSLRVPSFKILYCFPSFHCFHYPFFMCLGMGWDWVHLVRLLPFGLLYQPRMMDDDECGAIGWMRIGRGKRSTRRKPATVLFGSPQIPYVLTRARIRVDPMGSRRLTAWATARTNVVLIYY